MMMQGGHTHPRHAGQFVQAHRFSIVVPDPRDGFRSPVALISYGRDRSKASTRRTAQEPVDDLALNEGSEEGDVLRCRQQVY